MDLCLKNGKIYRNGCFFDANLYIKNGKISKISSANLKAEKNVDCKGKFILPGFIDAHVHMRVPGFEKKEDWKTGSRAALAGGVTTVLDMPNTKPATTTIEALEKKRKIAARNSLVNFGFYFGATANNSEEIKKVRNIAAVKIYMGASTGGLLLEKDEKINEIFRICSKAGKRVAVHAEDNKLLEKNLEKARKEKWNSVEKHNLIRSNEVSKNAVEKAVKFCAKNKTKTHICHVSTAEEIEIIENAKKRLPLSCEATPHHLFLGADSLKKLGNFGKINPPLRENYDRGVLWDAVNRGVIDIIATDHSPHLKSEKKKDYFNAPAGMPELDTFAPLMLNATEKGNIEFREMVALCCEHPAKIFGIKNKGFIKEGFDADLIVVDLDAEGKISEKNLFTKCGWSPYAGMKLRGAVEKTIVNGNLAYDKGKIISNVKGKEVVF